MPLELIIAVVVTLPIIAGITAFVWYLNLGGALSKLKKADRTSRSSGTSRIETEKA
jgi:hypothetical protein